MGARADGMVRRALAQWWSQRDRWFTNSVKAVLLLVCVVSLGTFFSFRSIWTLDAVRSEVGRPSPWLTVEKVEQFDPTGEKHSAAGGMKIVFASVAWLFLGAGFLAYYAYWRIRKLEAGRVSRWESPLAFAWLCAVWAIGAMVCALWPVFTSASAPPSGGHDVGLLHVLMTAAIVGFLAWFLWFWRKLRAERHGGASASPVPSSGASQVNSIGRISLWTSITGVVLPVLLALGGSLLAERLDLTEGYLVLCLLLGIGLEVAAMGCGMVGWRSKSGKAGLMISVLSLVLFALVFCL
jgi:hypothetical protein